MPNTPPPDTAAGVVRGKVVLAEPRRSPSQAPLVLVAHEVQEASSTDRSDTDKMYRSDVVVLPSTVPELIRAYETTFTHCQKLQQLFDQIAAPECALRGPSGVAATPPSAAIVAGSSPVAQPAAAPPPATAGGVVKGRVLGGAVVGSAPSPSSKEDPAKHRSALSAEDVKRLVRGVTESGDAQLKSEVNSLTTRVRELQSENETLRTAATSGNTADEASPSATPRLTSLLDDAKRHQQREDALRYEHAQLRAQLADGNKKRALLEEVTKQLEGQIQRLLSSSAALMGDEPPLKPRTPAASADATATASSAATATTDASNHASAGGNQNRTTGQVAALEKQIDHLRGMVDKLQKDVDTGEQRRTKLEAALRKTRQELATAKESLLHFRRQVNESEIAAETDATDRDSEERARTLEKECIRLRAAFAERKSRFAAELNEASAARLALERDISVYRRAVPDLLQRLTTLQIQHVVRTQLMPSAGALASSSPPHRGRTGDDAEAETAGSEHDASETSGLRAGRSASSATAPGSPTTPATTDRDARADAAPPTPSAPPAPPQTLSDAQQALLHEIKTTYERRIESLQAHMKAEAKHLNSLNKELRVALAASQDEARLNARQLERLRDADATVNRPRFPSNAFLSPDSAVCSPERSTVMLSRVDSFDTSPLPTMRVLERGTSASRELSLAEQRYDPENMPTWEAVQIENEALLARLSAMQEDKWRLSSRVEDLQNRCSVLEESHQRQNASRSQQLMNTLRTQRGENDAHLRPLQTLLQETLQENMVLQDELDKFKTRFGRSAV